MADWLGGIRTNSGGERARVILETSNVVKDSHYRGDKLIRHWLSHLAAHLAGGPLTTKIVSIVGEVTLRPLPPGEAAALFKTLLLTWHLGMRQPLPLAAKTAFAWLKAMPAPVNNEGTADQSKSSNPMLEIKAAMAANLDKARSAARKTYEGDFKQKGEVGNCAYLQRAYPSFDALFSDGAFPELAEKLLRPLQLAIFVDGKKADNPVAQTNAGDAA